MSSGVSSSSLSAGYLFSAGTDEHTPPSPALLSDHFPEIDLKKASESLFPRTPARLVLTRKRLLEKQLVLLSSPQSKGCLFHAILEQLPKTLCPSAGIDHFKSYLLANLGKDTSEQIKLDEIEIILSLIGDYFKYKENKTCDFDLTLLFADQDGEVFRVAEEKASIGIGHGSISLNIIVTSHNYYQSFLQANSASVTAAMEQLTLNSPAAPPLPNYIINMPVRVVSDDEGPSSSDEEDDNTFPANLFQDPSRFFRIKKPKDKKCPRGRIQLPTLTHDGSAETGKMNLASLPLLEKEAAKLPNRISLVVGFNKMRSLSHRRNQALVRRLKEKVESTLAVSTIGFFWEGIWEKSEGTGWRETDYATVRKFYRQLKKKNPTLAKQFREATEKLRGHQVPYREMRDTIKNHELTKAQIRASREAHPGSDNYICFFDDDIRSFHQSPTAPSAFQIFNHHYLTAGFEICSTGYTIQEPENPLLELAVLADLTVRQATAKHLKRGVYYPEPCTAVKIPPEKETIPENFSDPKDRDYTSPMEMPRLIDQILRNRQLSAQQAMVFDSRGAIVTTLPSRMEKLFIGRVSKRNDIIFWRSSDFTTMHGLSQTHYSPRDWAQNLLRTIKLPPYLKIDDYILNDQKEIRRVMISLLSRLFNAYDPVELAQLDSVRKKIPFQMSLIQVLKDYPASIKEQISLAFRDWAKRKPTKDKAKDEAVRKLWDRVDYTGTLKELKAILVEFVEKESQALFEAAKECGQSIADLFKKKLCLNYQELIIDTLAELANVPMETMMKTIPQIYRLLIDDTSAFDAGSKKEIKDALASLILADFFWISPLHIAALVGNPSIVEWLLANYQYKSVVTNASSDRIEGKPNILALVDGEGRYPFDYGLIHCKNNGLNLGLLKVLYTDRIEGEIQERVCEVFGSDLERTLILNHLAKLYGRGLICKFDGGIYIQAVLKGYNKVEEAMGSLGDPSSALFEAILDLAPDVNAKLIEAAKNSGSAIIGDVREGLCESDQQTFNMNLDALYSVESETEDDCFYDNQFHDTEHDDDSKEK